MGQISVRVIREDRDRSRDRTWVDGLCNFEKVPLDQLCPIAKRDYQVRVRVRVRKL